MPATVKYRRLLLKVSGESLAGEKKFGLDPATLQAIALSLGLFALLLLTLVRDDLLESWRSQVPAGAPNRFVINIQPEQVGEVRQILRGAGQFAVRAAIARIDHHLEWAQDR